MKRNGEKRKRDNKEKEERKESRNKRIKRKKGKEKIKNKYKIKKGTDISVRFLYFCCCIRNLETCKKMFQEKNTKNDKHIKASLKFTIV